jgi:shikimate dehydrogenase
VGLVRDLRQNLGQELAGASIMIIGAGGASRGIIGPLLEAGAGSMWIANRTAERARALGEVFASKGKVSWSGLDRLPGHTLDLLINASSAGHEGEFPELPPTLVNDEQTLCYDLSYGAAAKPFLDWAARAGASRRVDGLGMLVEQAAESFHIWTGRHANTGPVLRALKSKAA